MTKTTALIETRQLGMSYPLGNTRVDVLRGLDMRIEAGTRVAIAGPSGSGKTSLLLLLSGLERPSAGQVTGDADLVRTILGVDEEARSAKTLGQHRRGSGVVIAPDGLILALRPTGQPAARLTEPSWAPVLLRYPEIPS